MKKVLSVVLCLCVLLSSLTTVLFSTASADATGSVFDDPANWKVYAFNTTYLNETDGVAGASWVKVNKNVNTAYTYNGDESSISFYAKSQFAVVDFEVKANKDYKLSYRFLSNTDTLGSSTVNSTTYEYLLCRSGIIVPDGSVQ